MSIWEELHAENLQDQMDDLAEQEIEAIEALYRAEHADPRPMTTGSYAEGGEPRA